MNEYQKALLKTIEVDGADLIREFGMKDTIENLRMMPNPRLEWWSERQITDKPFPFKKSADMLAIELITQFTDQAMAGNGVVYIGAVNVKHANSSAPAPKKHRNNPSD